MASKTPTATSTRVVLRGIAERNVFWTTYRDGDDPTRLIDGTVAYKVIAYTDSDAEAIRIWLDAK